MKITVKNIEYDSGKIGRKKFKAYSELRDRLTDKEVFSDEDLDKMVKVLVDLFDNQFTEDDINEDFEVSDIIFNFARVDIEISVKVNTQAEKTASLFMKDKK